MDWGIVISSAVTGVVGIAGIGGSLLSTRVAGKSAAANLKTTIAAEHASAWLNEKRQVYVRYLAAGDDLINSMAKYHALGDDADDTMTNVLVIERGAAFTGVLNTLGELLLIAPEHIMLLADKATTILGAMKPEPADFRDAREQLIWAMRADRGESAPDGS